MRDRPGWHLQESWGCNEDCRKSRAESPLEVPDLPGDLAGKEDGFATRVTASMLSVNVNGHGIVSRTDRVRMAKGWNMLLNSSLPTIAYPKVLVSATAR